MSKKQTLDILMLLSALESWAFSDGKHLPDYLHDNLSNAVDVLTREILDSELALEQEQQAENN